MPLEARSRYKHHHHHHHNRNDKVTTASLNFRSSSSRPRSQSLTFAWLLRQAENVCPLPHQIRSLVEPSGVVCYQNGGVTDLTKKALKSFVRVNKSAECEASLTRIQSKCEIDALINVVVPLVPKETMATRIETQTRRNLAAIRCTLSKLGSLAPACGSVKDLRIYQLVSELIQKQPFKLRGDVDFRNFF
ncbi:hypothetical protein KP79_PYT14551 [Mizuhopecten yessoensis]|uniref:Uncharacterized protein n=1 Tax=Mizuhopecten yessoensis TaxID=6573 RepID=A0A210Q8L9_MIZYE|nr:hypothetical protein KP79_PYT14551 [Mizuhopecten yessoensis]